MKNSCTDNVKIIRIDSLKRVKGPTQENFMNIWVLEENLCERGKILIQEQETKTFDDYFVFGLLWSDPSWPCTSTKHTLVDDPSSRPAEPSVTPLSKMHNEPKVKVEKNNEATRNFKANYSKT